MFGAAIDPAILIVVARVPGLPRLNRLTAAPADGITGVNRGGQTGSEIAVVLAVALALLA
jgi:hypothetical protein